MRLIWRGERALVVVLSMLGCVLWTWHAGKDINFDFLHYHVYSGFSALHDRFGQDFMPAGGQSYFNPYAQVPLYLMMQAQWAPWVIGGMLAAFHSLNLWICYEIARLVFKDLGDGRRRWVLAAVGCAALNPLLLLEVGTSFTDISTSLIFLGSLCLVLRAIEVPRAGILWVAGLLAGFAAALKLSNIIYAAVLLPVSMLFVGQGLRSRLLSGGGLLLGMAAGFLIGHGYWGYRLWVELGNPLFPFFNAWFKSPLLPEIQGQHGRFLVDGLWGGVQLPFRMALPLRNIYTETALPDVRYALIWSAVPVLFLKTGLLHWRSSARSCLSHAGAAPVTQALWVFFGMSWALWILSGSNGRYMLPLSFLSGILLASLMREMLPSPRRALVYAMVLLTCVQGTQFVFGSQFRWSPVAWGQEWLEVEVPQRLRQEPALYLVPSLTSASFVLPYLHPNSGMAQIGGQQAMGMEGRGAAQLQRLLDQYEGRVWAMSRTDSSLGNFDALKTQTEKISYQVARLGFRVHSEECEAIGHLGALPLQSIEKGESLLWSQASRAPKEGVVDPVDSSGRKQDIPSTSDRGDLEFLFAGAESHRQAWLLTLACPLTVASELLNQHKAEVEVIDQVLNRIEELCPNVFYPPGQLTERLGKSNWFRYYVGSDMQINVKYGRILYMDAYRLGEPIDIGAVSDWIEGVGNINCSKRKR